MQRFIAILLIGSLLSGCALTTIKAPKKKANVPASRPVYERPVYEPKPVPRTVITQEKEEVMPMKEEIMPTKEERLPMKEEILPMGGNDTK